MRPNPRTSNVRAQCSRRRRPISPRLPDEHLNAHGLVLVVHRRLHEAFDVRHSLQSRQVFTRLRVLELHANSGLFNGLFVREDAVGQGQRHVIFQDVNGLFCPSGCGHFFRSVPVHETTFSLRHVTVACTKAALLIRGKGGRDDGYRIAADVL